MAYDDAFQEGSIGLWQAAERYNGSTPFPVFAIKRIRGAVIDAQRILIGRSHIKPQNTALSIQFYEIDVVSEYSSLDAFEDELELDSRRESLYKKIASLPSREGYVLRERLKGRSFFSISQTLGLSESRCCQVDKRAKRLLLR